MMVFVLSTKKRIMGHLRDNRCQALWITNGMVRRLYLASSLCMRGLRRRRPMELHTIGIDLGKTVFHLVGLNSRGEVVMRKKFSRTQLLRFTANVHVGLIGMEACGGSHFLGRALREQRHEV